MNKTRSLILFFGILSLFAILPAQTKAWDEKSGLIVAKDQVLEKNVYAFGQSVIIEGEVNGDVICVTDSLIISGKINGDVICLTQSASLQGVIEGDARILVANDISLSGKIGKNVNIGATKITISKLSVIGGDLLAFANTAEISGLIGRDVSGFFGEADISGHIGRDIKLNLDGEASAASIKDQAYVGGSVTYESTRKNLSVSKDSYINGKVTHYTKEVKSEHKKVFGFGWFYALAMSLVIGLALAGFAKDRVLKITQTMSQNSGRALTRGALLFFLLPGILVFLILTIVGIPLAVLLSLLIFSFIFVAKAIAGIWLGEKILEKTHWQEGNLLIAAVIGIISTKLLFTIPILGWLLSFAALLWVTGAVWVRFREKKEIKEQKKPAKKTVGRKIAGKKK